MKPNHIILVFLLLSASVSWLMRSSDAFLMSLAGLFVYLVWRIGWAVSREAARPPRERSQEPMPMYSLYGTTLGMTGPVAGSGTAQDDRALADAAAHTQNAALHGGSIRDTQTRMEERDLADLIRVQLLTTGQAPFLCDMFLILLFRDGSEWRIAADNPGYLEFYAALDARLNLDAEQSVRASCSTGEDLFPLWEKGRHEPEPINAWGGVPVGGGA